METTAIDFPIPERDAINSPYWEALERGELTYQSCVSCGHHWLPARSECPDCLSDKWRWERASGGAKLISWVVYHMAYHTAFEKRLPYAVAIVELDEGPRLISNVVGVADLESLVIDQRLVLVIEEEHGVAIPRFKPTS